MDWFLTILAELPSPDDLDAGFSAVKFGGMAAGLYFGFGFFHRIAQTLGWGPTWAKHPPPTQIELVGQFATKPELSELARELENLSDEMKKDFVMVWDRLHSDQQTMLGRLDKIGQRLELMTEKLSTMVGRFQVWEERFKATGKN